jgi:hypothetical protein
MKAALSIIFLTLTLIASAQDSSIRPSFDRKYNPYQVEFPQGAAWLYSSAENSFYFVIYSNKVYATNTPDLYVVNDKIFRSFIFNPMEPIPPGELDSITTDGIMRKYIKGRIGIFGKNQEVGNPKTRMRTLRGGRWIMEWNFQTPNDELILGHVFLSTICFDRILTLNRPIRKGEELKQAKIWLRKLANSIEEKDEPLGPKKLGEKLKGDF